MIGRIIRKIKRDFRKSNGIRKAKEKGICFSEPNYIYFDNLDADSILVDVGCASDPDLSLYFMKLFDLTAFAVDPTRKHGPSLKSLEKTHKKLQHVDLAVADRCQSLTFHESVENDSGSLLGDHKNVVNGSVNSYEVEAVDIEGLMKHLNLETIDYLKLDLEGIEYALLEKIDKDQFSEVKQLFIEFHHHCIAEKSESDTAQMVALVESFGFKSFTIDGANYLFYR